MWRSVLAVGICAGLGMAGAVQAGQTVWHFDNLKHIGGFKVQTDGHPKVVETPLGKALRFDGVHDSVLIEGRPLIGASTFTIEAVFKPDGGAFAQRFMHIAETDPKTGLDTPPDGLNDTNGRSMSEIRVAGDLWYFDAYINSKAGGHTLAFPDKKFPIGKWYTVAQTYDGKTYRSYVNGVLQGEADIAFTPQGPGHVRIGARMNRTFYFNGSVVEARFTDHALAPDQLLTIDELQHPETRVDDGRSKP